MRGYHGLALAAAGVVIAAELCQGQEGKRPTLDVPVSNEKPVDGAELKDVLEFWSDRHGLRFVVDHAAFQRAKADRPEETRVKVPKFVRVRLDIVLTVT